MVVAKLRVRSVAEPRFCHSWCLNSRQLMPQLSTGFNGYIQTMSKLKNWAWGAEVQSNSYKKESKNECTRYILMYSIHSSPPIPPSSWSPRLFLNFLARRKNCNEIPEICNSAPTLLVPRRHHSLTPVDINIITHRHEFLFILRQKCALSFWDQQNVRSTLATVWMCSVVTMSVWRLSTATLTWPKPHCPMPRMTSHVLLSSTPTSNLFFQCTQAKTQKK